MKFIYDHSVMMHVRLHEDVIGSGEVFKGITVFKFFIWEGISLDIRSEI